MTKPSHFSKIWLVPFCNGDKQNKDIHHDYEAHDHATEIQLHNETLIKNEDRNAKMYPYNFCLCSENTRTNVKERKIMETTSNPGTNSKSTHFHFSEHPSVIDWFLQI